MKNLDFVFMLVVQCKILQILNIPSKSMKCKPIDLISAIKLLQTAAQDIAQIKQSFDIVSWSLIAKIAHGFEFHTMGYLGKKLFVILQISKWLD